MVVTGAISRISSGVTIRVASPMCRCFARSASIMSKRSCVSASVTPPTWCSPQDMPVISSSSL